MPALACVHTYTHAHTHTHTHTHVHAQGNIVYSASHAYAAMAVTSAMRGFLQREKLLDQIEAEGYAANLGSSDDGGGSDHAARSPATRSAAAKTVNFTDLSEPLSPRAEGDVYGEGEGSPMGDVAPFAKRLTSINRTASMTPRRGYGSSGGGALETASPQRAHASSNGATPRRAHASSNGTTPRRAHASSNGTTPRRAHGSSHGGVMGGGITPRMRANSSALRGFLQPVIATTGTHHVPR